MKLTRLAAAAGLLVAAGIGGVAVAGPASAYPGGTVGTANGRAAIRCAFDNWSTTLTDVDILQTAVRDIGAELRTR